MAEQLELFPEDPKQEKPVDKEKVDKARARAAENEEFKDKRVKASPLTVESELAKMREILAKPKAEKQEQARMKYGNPVLEAAQAKSSGGSRGGGGGGIPSDKMDKMKKMNYKAGGKVTASSRADGCAIRGKTKGRMV